MITALLTAAAASGVIQWILFIFVTRKRVPVVRTYTTGPRVRREAARVHQDQAN